MSPETNASGTSKKVLVIMGSPRKRGNGFKVIKKIEERISSMGNVDFEYLYLKEADLEMCKGCFVCVRRGEDRCPIKDGREEIERKMLETDGIIFYSPVYGLNVSGLMKQFIDRFCYAGHHPRFFGQNALYVATTCGMGLDGAFKAFEYLEGWGFHTVGRLGVETPHYKIAARKRARQERAIENAADMLFEAISPGTMPSPQSQQIFQFNIMKAGFLYRPDLRKAFPADLDYWSSKGWLEGSSSFFYETRLALHHVLYGWMIRTMVRLTAPFMQVK
jgi:multimeric flavodoxin WrbA